LFVLPQARIKRAVYALAICAVALVPQNALASSSISLKTTTTADQTASIGLPSGWTLAKGGNGFVFVAGPNGERINLGALVVVKNAPVGTAVGGEVAFAMPFRSSLEDRLTTIIESGAAKQGMAAPHITYATETKMKLPMCEQFTGGWTAGDQSRTFEGIICSLQPDYLGLYKNLVFLSNTPSSHASADRPIIEKIVNSYRVTPAMFKKMLSPYTPMPPASAMKFSAPYEDPTNSDCFDYNVIRESPPWEMPMHCGGWQPG
jgi:hypothetical protein